MRCWAFPHPEREVFDQVVLMGYRKADPVPDAHGESMVLEWAVGEPEPMRPEQYPPFTPKTTPSGDILFTTRTVDPVAAAAEARRSGLWTSTEITWTPSGPPGRSTGRSSRPPWSPWTCTTERSPTSQHRRLAPRAAPQGPAIPLPGNGGASLRLDATPL